MINLKIILNNKFQKEKYVVKKIFEAGIILYGWEVKGLRIISPNIKNSFVIIKKSKVFLVNSLFFPYTQCCQYRVFLKRNRELLLSKKEIFFIKNFRKVENRMSILVSKIYWKNNFIKLELMLVKTRIA